MYVIVRHYRGIGWVEYGRTDNFKSADAWCDLLRSRGHDARVVTGEIEEAAY